MKSEISPLRKITVTALLCAVGVALGYLPHALTFLDSLRLDLSGLPVILVAMLFGPLWSTAAFGITDVLGCLVIGDSIFPPICLCKMLAGFFFGLFWKDRKITLVRALISFGIVAVICDFLLMGVTLHHYFRMEWSVLAVTRLITAAVNMTVRVLFVFFAAEPLTRRMKKALYAGS